MSRVESTIEVRAPLRAVYNQWTQFESFPEFMSGVEQVRQISDSRMHWRANIGGREKEWVADIVEQVPDERIVWRSVDGAPNAGVVTFHPVDAEHTQVHLELSYETEGLVEGVGDALGLPERRIEGDLERFRDFMEERGLSTGAWRGEIANDRLVGGHTAGRPEMNSPDVTTPAGGGTAFSRALTPPDDGDVPEASLAPPTQSGGRNITRDRLEANAGMRGQTIDEQEREIADAAGLPQSALSDAPRSSAAGEARISSDATLSNRRANWSDDDWAVLRGAVSAHWPDVPPAAFDGAERSHEGLVEAIGSYVSMPRAELEREIDSLTSGYRRNPISDTPRTSLEDDMNARRSA
ncbi:MAG: SRPBCC family protein [Dehalococcoidia bacterium]